MIGFVYVDLRLKGLCDNVDTGPESFHDHEICFSLRTPNQTVSISCKIQKKDFFFKLESIFSLI